ncbi:MAG TPA: DUF748 domain-containing protein [Planctomycetota bacterium]|nr:DUF748 domain-containing protein [Planctomycetota bacterium]
MDPAPSSPPKSPQKAKHRWGRRVLVALLVVAVVAGLTAALLPGFVRDYVNRVLDQNEQYAGVIGEVHLQPWRGAYSIEDVRLSKTTGNIPVPFFTAERVDFSMETNALLHGRLVGRVRMVKPEINFVDAGSSALSQTGAGGPWLAIIRDLYPFKINSAEIVDGNVHFRAFQTEPSVDVYLSHVEGTIENLTNIYDELTPMFSTVTVKALAMDQARVEYEMKLDPFSYRPSFQLALRLLGLDVTKTNALARAYGNFDFEAGWFDLVAEFEAKEGGVTGYVKPLFRNLRVFDLRKDSRNPLQAFWEALVGIAATVFKNQARDQVGTLIPISGRLDNPNADYLATLGNLLRNAFVRAYLPKLQGKATEISGLTFAPGSVSEPEAIK